MTREKAIKILKQRVAIDRQNIMNSGKSGNDFDKFITEQDEALDVAIEIMENSVDRMDENKHDFESKYMDARRFLEEVRRMCEYYKVNDCEGCPAADVNLFTG